MVREYFSKNAKSKVEVDGQENSFSILEENELVQMKNDFVIEHDEMVAYESLIREVQMANMHQWHESVYMLEKSMKEEESMAYWYKIHTPLIFDSLWPKMIHSSVRRGQNYGNTLTMELISHTKFTCKILEKYTWGKFCPCYVSMVTSLRFYLVMFNGV
jgi:hypothetical protein